MSMRTGRIDARQQSMFPLLSAGGIPSTGIRLIQLRFMRSDHRDKVSGEAMSLVYRADVWRKEVVIPREQ